MTLLIYIHGCYTAQNYTEKLLAEVEDIIKNLIQIGRRDQKHYLQAGEPFHNFFWGEGKVYFEGSSIANGRVRVAGPRTELWMQKQ